jgi:cytochrome c
MPTRLFLIGIIITSVVIGVTAQSRRPSVWDGIYSVAQAERGHILYDAHCARCHGEHLEGSQIRPVEVPPKLQWQGPPSLRDGEFRANWNDMSIGDLFERIRISMPQNAPGTLTRQQNADILAYILSENSYPSDRKELPYDKAILDQITFLVWGKTF